MRVGASEPRKLISAFSFVVRNLNRMHRQILRQANRDCALPSRTKAIVPIAVREIPPVHVWARLDRDAEVGGVFGVDRCIVLKMPALTSQREPVVDKLAKYVVTVSM